MGRRGLELLCDCGGGWLHITGRGSGCLWRVRMHNVQQIFLKCLIRARQHVSEQIQSRSPGLLELWLGEDARRKDEEN